MGPVEIPSFAGDGDEFERLVGEILADEGRMFHAFGAHGRDGGIDLTRGLVRAGEVHAIREVVQCKVIGEPGHEAACRRWRDTASVLDKHTASPDGPGQAQYAPWYRSAPPIGRFVYCISSTLANENHFDTVRDAIREDFKRLARRPHLRHLETLEIEVLDWSRLRDRLTRAPRLAFRWFPELIPRGLRRLEQGARRHTFRAYLSSDTLPFYSLEQHLVAQPSADFVAESALLDTLFDEQFATGLLITGAGGVGKSRLALELARHAERRGLLVLSAARATADSLEALCRHLHVDDRALLLVDYVETQPRFADLVECVAELGEDLGVMLRLVATCRTAYAPQLAGLEGLQRLDLSPPSAQQAAWLDGYRDAAIRHILASTSVTVSAELLDQVNGRPALAVFVGYLQERGDSSLDFDQLYAEPDFGTWFSRQVQKTFSARGVAEELALWMGLLPLSAEVAASLHDTLDRRLFDRLATDRWIERVDDETGERWFAAHDLLADQVVLSYLAGQRQLGQRFVARWLEIARRHGVLDSALVALQRLADSAAFADVDFLAVLRGELADHPHAWRPHREALLRTPLLTPDQIVDLLDKESPVWADAVDDSQLHFAFGGLARTIARANTRLTARRHRKLVAWLERLAPRGEGSFFILGCALLLDHRRFADKALAWLQANHLRDRASFVLKTWLRAGGAVDAVRVETEQWLSVHGTKESAHFVLKAWMDAGGDVDAVRVVTARWLQLLGTRASAGFVLTSWLRAGGDLEQVREPIARWLASHRLGEPARFVLTAWLDASGAVDSVRAATETWLVLHGSGESAQFVLKSWLDAGGAVDSVRAATEAWLASHGSGESASFVLKAWLDAGGAVDSVRSATVTWLGLHGSGESAQFVLTAWLDVGGAVDTVRGATATWLASHGSGESAPFVLKSWLDAGGAVDSVRAATATWLAAHGSGESAQFVLKAWLDAGGEADSVRSATATWLASHGSGESAQFVLKAWLDAGGEADSVRAATETWLAAHGSSKPADFVLKAWLEAGGSFDVVRDSALAWLAVHRLDPGAAFLTKFIVKQHDLPPSTVGDVLAWCEANASNADAVWRLSGLSRHLFEPQELESAARIAERILPTLLDSEEALQELVAPTMGVVLQVLRARGCDVAGRRTRATTDALLARWIGRRGTLAHHRSIPFWIQRPLWVLKLIDLLDQGRLDLERDQDALAEFWTWLGRWEPQHLAKVKPLVAYLRRRFPSGLWDQPLGPVEPLTSSAQPAVESGP
ncbi:MAG: hypothetical protein AAGC60_00690 [Acidobacteriota bacterium]